MSSVLSQMLLGAAPPVVQAHRYWRIYDSAGVSFSGYWNLSYDAGLNGIFSSSDLTGTDLGYYLTYASTVGFGNPTGYSSGTVGGGSGNPFSDNSTLYYADTAAPRALNMDFGSAYEVHSLQLSPPSGYPGRMPSNPILLQWSDDNSSWTTYATLTNTGLSTCRWQNITNGSTIAAT